MGPLICILLINTLPLAQCLNCDTLLHSPDSEGNGTTNGQFYVHELEGTDYKELVGCLSTIGEDPLPQEQANNVWSALKKVGESR